MLIPGGRDIRVRKNVLRVTALLPFTKGVPLFSEYIRPTSHTRLSVLPKKLMKLHQDRYSYGQWFTAG